MKVKEAAQNPTKHSEEAISDNPAVTSAVSKKYLESVRGHYLSALAGLNTGKQEQNKIIYNSGAFSASEDNDSEQAAEAEQTSMQRQLEQRQTFTEMDMQIHLSKGVMGACEENLEAIKLQLNKTLAKNNEQQISEMVGRVEVFGQEVETEALEVEANRAGLSEPGILKESLLKGVIEGTSLQRMVKSLKAELENLKKEHAELKDKGAGAEFSAGNLRFKLLRSKFEDEGCIVNEAKVIHTLEDAVQNQPVEDLKIKGKGLKREHESSKVSTPGEKRSRVALDVDEVKEPKVSGLLQNKGSPGRVYPVCVSTSESSARMRIPEDELEASSLKEEKLDKLERGKLDTLTGRVELEKYDYSSEFSIRDFVFAARNKDISLNWPFSQKNLQLCLKHGVKDVLPPFQPMDSLRESSMKRYTAETSCNSEESNLDNRPVLLKNHLTTSITKDHRWNHELAEGYRDSDSFPSSGGEKDLAFKATATANSEVESVSTSNLPLSEVSDERVAAASAVNDKTKSSASQLSDKKCQVPLKLRISTCRSAAEDITSACTVPCEVMTSQICPVCEAFSSSSNTTLNAHIDQCLSSQSTPNWINPKLIKPRVKPRKIRLMSDICATAPRCTLEDLDRRNGTNWATNADSPTPDTEVLTEGKSHRVSSRYLANNGDDGAVYIDSSGRKIRILSKFNDMPSLSLPKATEDLRAEKQTKKGMTNIFFSSTRKRRLAKRLKYLKVNRQKKRFSSLKVKGCPNEAFVAGEATAMSGEEHVEEQELAHFAKNQEQRNAGVSGSSRLWISSNRSNLSKKCDSQNISRHCRYELRTTKERQASSYPSHKGRMHINKHSGSLKKCIPAQESSMRIPGLYGAGSDRSDGSCGKGILDGPSLRVAIQGNRESYLVPLKVGAAQFHGENTKGVPQSLDSTVTPPSSLEAEVYVKADAVESVDSLFPDSRKLLDSSHSSPLKGMKAQNSRAHTLSPSLSPVHAYQSNSYQKNSPVEKSFGYGRNRREDLWSADRSQHSDAVPDHRKSSMDIDSLHHCSMTKVQKQRELEVGDVVSGDHNEADGLQDGSQVIYGRVRSTIIGLHGNGEVIAPPVPSAGLSVVGTVVLSSCSGPELQNTVDVEDPKSNSLSCSDKYRVPLFRTEARAPPNESGLRDDHEILYRNTVGGETLQFETGDSHFNVDHQNSFPEVDPIPIPGPPGSDLPSFSDMGSEDLHRNSSLSGCLAQSSGDGDYIVDGDLSDSPLSATSTVSNLGIKDDHTISESLTVTLPVSDSVYPGWICASSEPMVGTSAMFTQFAPPSAERFVSLVDNSNKSVVAHGGDPYTLKSDSQQCCCSRKEGIPWSSALNFEESRLLGSRMGTMAALPLGNSTTFILNRGTDLADRTVLPISCCTRGDSENLAYPLENSHQGSMPVEVTSEAGISFSRNGDCDSSSPSAPILRLMGKDLMVINKERDDRSRNPTAQNACTNSQMLPVSELSSGFSSWQHHPSQDAIFMAPPVLEQDPRTLAMRHFDFGASNMISNPRNSKQASGGMYVNKRMHASFSSPPSPLDR